MPKASQARTNARKEEIISACAALYETMSFKDITLKDISQATSFTRTSIYNYFQTKEEIFLALLQRERDVLQDGRPAEALFQMLDFQNGHVRSSSQEKYCSRFSMRPNSSVRMPLKAR